MLQPLCSTPRVRAKNDRRIRREDIPYLAWCLINIYNNDDEGILNFGRCHGKNCTAAAELAVAHLRA